MQTNIIYGELHGFENFSTSNLRSPSNQDFNDNVFIDTLRTNPSTQRIYALPKAVYSNPSRSFSGRMTSDNFPERPVTPNDVVDIDPELKEVRRSGKGYHVQLDLKANIFENFRRPASALQTRALSRQVVESRSALDQTGYFQNEKPLNYITGGRKSVLGLTYDNPVLPPIPVHTPASPFKNYDSKTVLNLEASKNSSMISESNNFGEEFIIKSIRQSESSLSMPTQNDYSNEDVQFDLRLIGSTVNDSRTVVESEVVKSRSSGKKRPVVPAIKSKKKHNKLPEDEVDMPAVYRRSKLQEVVADSDVEAKPKKPETRDAAVEVAKKQMQQKSCNTDPEFECKSVQTLCTFDKPTQTEPEPVVLPTNNDIYLDSSFRESQPVYVTETRSAARGRPISQNEEYEDLYPSLRIPEERNVDSSIFIKRLLKDAPQGSLRQTMNVEKEEDEIVGPFPKEEIEQMYSNSMINVDSVSEKVDLVLSDGIAHLILKIIYERIVPVKDSVDTFKKSAVVVTKLIDVDLTVTEERMNIYQHVLENHKNGRLDNKYTFELYKAFVAMADSDKQNGADQELQSVEKKIEEEKLFNHEARTASTNGPESFQILEKKLSNINEEPMKLHSKTAFSSSSTTQRIPSVYASFNGTEHNTSRSASFEWDSHARSSDVNTQPESAFDMSTLTSITEKVDQFFPNQYYKAKGVENWKSIYSGWTDEASKVNEKYFGSSRDRKPAPRLNVHEYLRPGGNRFPEAAKELFWNSSETSNMYGAESEELTSLEQSVSNEVLRKAGLRDGSHRQRMQSYEKVLSP